MAWLYIALRSERVADLFLLVVGIAVLATMATTIGNIEVPQ